MEITIPFRYTPRDYQKPLFNALHKGFKRMVVVWHRRAGKDKTCFNIMIKEAFKRKGTYFYFLPEYSQAKKVIWDNIDNDGFRMLDHIPKEIIKSTNGTELKVELVNGSIIQLIGADSFEKSGVGTNPVGVVFSEYSINNPQVWNFVRPILVANKGWAIFNFTPRGTNHAYELLEKAKDNDKWFSQVLTVKDTNVLTEEDLAEEKADMPEDLFEQEYYCKFLEGAGQFFRKVEDSVYVGPPDPIDKTHRYQIGVDLAKYQDYTVVTTIDLATFYVREIERFNQLDYTTQKARIESTSLRHKTDRLPLVRVDSTGVGEPIYEDLAERGLSVEPYQFTERSRRELLTNLQLKLEQGLIRIPKDDRLIAELKSMQYVLTDRGKLKIQVPDGMHDDMIMSLALAVWDLPTYPITPNAEGIRFLKRPMDNVGGAKVIDTYE